VERIFVRERKHPGDETEYKGGQGDEDKPAGVKALIEQ
jgi:hypothetical protein